MSWSTFSRSLDQVQSAEADHETRLTLQAAWATGVTLSLHPETTFSDPVSGRTAWTPALRPDDGADYSLDEAPLHPTLPGQSLGRYTLLKKAGEGGFGEVWKAHQERPVEREVAVKVLKTGLHSQRARARFEVEQRALAKLDHPHITRYLEGGTTRDGRLYFVMEWVEGQSLTRACQEAQAALPERLRLFRQVGEAVHHAHQKGLLHRDLKPSNVMVTGDGEQPSARSLISASPNSWMIRPLTRLASPVPRRSSGRPPR